MRATVVDEPSRHKCLIYDGDPAEQLPVVLPLLLDGLRENWRCLYIGSPDVIEVVSSRLASEVDLVRETDRGALVFSSDRGHLVNGEFDADAMVDGLRQLTTTAVRDGFTGLCATGDMRWELGDDRNFTKLLDYEAKLEQVFEELPLRGICQYHRGLVPPQAIADALATHRSTYIGHELNSDNLFYVPPELLLDAHDETAPARYGDWMYHQIARVMNAERARDRALAAARRAEAEQRRLAEQLAEANRVLERRVAERTAELALANRDLEAFSYSVAHDLRAPLRAIHSFSLILAAEVADRLDAEHADQLGRIVRASERMSDRIAALLELAQIGRAGLTCADVDLSAIATTIVDELRARDPHRVAIVRIAPGIRASGDARLLTALLDNLLANAWKFTAARDPARIEVTQRVTDAGREVHVRDNGIGFDPQHASRLFAPFQRLHGDDIPGTGIGLATARRIVERHHGRIWAESSRDGGATFAFTLP